MTCCKTTVRLLGLSNGSSDSLSILYLSHEKSHSYSASDVAIYSHFFLGISPTYIIDSSNGYQTRYNYNSGVSRPFICEKGQYSSTKLKQTLVQTASIHAIYVFSVYLFDRACFPTHDRVVVFCMLIFHTHPAFGSFAKIN